MMWLLAFLLLGAEVPSIGWAGELMVAVIAQLIERGAIPFPGIVRQLTGHLDELTAHKCVLDVAPPIGCESVTRLVLEVKHVEPAEHRGETLINGFVPWLVYLLRYFSIARTYIFGDREIGKPEDVHLVRTTGDGLANSICEHAFEPSGLYVLDATKPSVREEEVDVVLTPLDSNCLDELELLQIADDLRRRCAIPTGFLAVEPLEHFFPYGTFIPAEIDEELIKRSRVELAERLAEHVIHGQIWF